VRLLDGVTPGLQSCALHSSTSLWIGLSNVERDLGYTSQRPAVAWCVVIFHYDDIPHLHVSSLVCPLWSSLEGLQVLFLPSIKTNFDLGLCFVINRELGIVVAMYWVPLRDLVCVLRFKARNTCERKASARSEQRTSYSVLEQENE